MLQFLKYTLATLTGLVLFSFVGLVLLFIVLAAVLSSSESKEEVKPNSILCLNMEGTLLDRTEDDIYSVVFGDDDPMLGLDEILKSISNAKSDSCIKGIYLKSGLFSAGYASIQEIRCALLDFKKSGKFVVAYSGAYSQGGYYLSSVADKIYLNPEGMLDLSGISSSAVFYKGMLQKLGVEMQVVKVGTYKSFTEQYTNTEMSQANRQQMEVLTSSMWNSILAEISQSRHIPVDSLNAAADDFMAFQPQMRDVRLGLVDGLKYVDEVQSELCAMLGLNADEEIDMVSPSDLILDDADQRSGSQKVAVVYAVGEIDNGNTDGINSSELIETMNKLRKDSDVKSVVLRVNSPGGSAYGSEQIWRAIELLKAKKPVFVSMGDYAASGGYYISCNATKIVAEPTTITGSIGIFSVIPNLEGLMDKVGVDYDVVKTNRYSDVPTMTRPMTDSERSMMQSFVDRGYHVFVKRCADGRSMPFDSVANIAQGRVWSGASAKEIGLVDQLGGLDETIKMAAKEVNVDPYEVEYYPKKKSWLDNLLDMPSLGMDKVIAAFSLKKEYQVVDRVTKIDRLQAIMPYGMEIK